MSWSVVGQLGADQAGRSAGQDGESPESHCYFNSKDKGAIAGLKQGKGRGILSS